MTELDIAERIARKAHADQKEESTGDDYIHHVERVVALVDGEAAKVVAWLHDVIEDSEITHMDLLASGLSIATVAAVQLLTRAGRFGDGRHYGDYVAHILASGNKAAIAVKIADLRDHLRPNCPSRLRPRYEAALKTLGG